MKRTLVVIVTIVALQGCAVHKGSNQEVVNILFSEYNEIVDGDITFSVVNDTKLNCDSSIVIVEISSVSPENVIFSLVGGSTSRINQPENHYVIVPMMPNCKGAYLSFSYRRKDGLMITLKEVDMNQFTETSH